MAERPAGDRPAPPHGIAMILRTVGGLAGGYALAWGLAVFGALVLPLPRANVAIVTSLVALAMVPAFLVWFCATRRPFLLLLAGAGLPVAAVVVAFRVGPW